MNNQTPGTGQVNPAISDAAIGDIKLGFVMSKGQLEITVFEARNLKKLEPNCRGTLETIFFLNKGILSNIIFLKRYLC